MAFVPLLQAAGTGTGVSSTSSFLISMLPFILIIVIMYVFMILPQNKKQKETEKMIAALKKGDKVVTAGGIHGVISSTKEQTVIVKVDENTKLEINRSSISSVEAEKSEKEVEKKSKAEDKAAAEEKTAPESAEEKK